MARTLRAGVVPVDERARAEAEARGLSPMEAVARAVARLAQVGVITGDQMTLHRSADALGVPVRMMREATERLALIPWVPPPDHRPSFDPTPERFFTERDPLRRPSPAPSGQPNQYLEPRRDGSKGRWPSPEHATGAERKPCARCKGKKPLAEFRWAVGNRRVDGTPVFRYSSYCNDCHSSYSRDRYLNEAKKEALAEAGVTFVIREIDLLADEPGMAPVVLACAGCQQPFAAGDEVHGTTQLRHTACTG